MNVSAYLPPLIENMESMVDEEGEMVLNEWVESQQHCPNFLFWENVVVEGSLNGEMNNAPPNNNGLNLGSANTNTMSSFPSSF